jgi:small subunit ribosomal protein S3
MGQRVNPYGFRLGVTKVPHARWYASTEKEYASMIGQDAQIRDMLEKKFRRAGISKIIIARSDHLNITMFVSSVGMIIGKKGAIIDALKAELDSKYGIETRINVKEVKRVDTDGAIVSNLIATKMEERSGGFKMHVKRAMQSAMDAGALGIKVLCSGRLGGAEIARDEEFVKGSVPLQTLQADISYGSSTAYTTAGTCGVKVWIYNGMNRRKYNPFEGLSDRVSRHATMDHERNEDSAV